jgi:hypothetical protein
MGDIPGRGALELENARPDEGQLAAGTLRKPLVDIGDVRDEGRVLVTETLR